MDILRRQLGNTVSVEVDAAPGQNLSSIMNEMRQKYEALAQENLQKAKEQFEMQVTALILNSKQCVAVLQKEKNPFSFLIFFFLSLLTYIFVLFCFVFIWGPLDSNSPATSHSEH